MGEITLKITYVEKKNFRDLALVKNRDIFETSLQIETKSLKTPTTSPGVIKINTWIEKFKECFNNWKQQTGEN